ncbi:MAG: hypothetical protein JKY96_05760 [Phycisphaerales bacterium]|nr:hypothetical protein [Phycisphaerales bacterium]
MNADQPGEGSTMNTIRWAAYLGCSWTWCIGMFFPALILRDFGIAGYMIFAIPNVLGAALMGWVLTTKNQSIKMVRDHAAAVGWFSVITIAFHVFWIVWLFGFAQAMLPIPEGYLFGAGAVAVAWTVVTGRGVRMGRESQLAIVLWIASAAILIATFVYPDAISPKTTEVIANINNESILSTGIIWLIPLSVLGFALNPYLDATFHHGRQQLGSTKNSRIGFTLGFGIMFASMIVLTFQYSGLIIETLNGNAEAITIHPLMGAAILAHIMCQWIFTVRVHLARLPLLPKGGPPLQLTYGLAIASGIVALLVPQIAHHAGLSAGEIVYRNYLGAYGLLFPAYVLYRIVRARKGGRPTKNLYLYLAIGIAAPMFWMGFIEGHTPWLTIGIVLLIAMAFVPNTRANKRTKPQTSD